MDSEISAQFSRCEREVKRNSFAVSNAFTFPTLRLTRLISEMGKDRTWRSAPQISASGRVLPSN